MWNGLSLRQSDTHMPVGRQDPSSSATAFVQLLLASTPLLVASNPVAAFCISHLGLHHLPTKPALGSSDPSLRSLCNRLNGLAPAMSQTEEGTEKSSVEEREKRAENDQLETADVLVGVGAHAGAATCAFIEIKEDLETIGHGHGILFLVASRLCREINVLRESAAQELEDLTETHATGVQKFRKKMGQSLNVLLRFLTSKLFSTAFSLGALYAASEEVFSASRPNGAHGTLLLATNELIELLEGTSLIQGRALRFLQAKVLRLALVGGAFVCAFMETAQYIASGTLGAHHGVLLLAVAKILRSIGLIRQQLK